MGCCERESGEQQASGAAPVELPKLWLLRALLRAYKLTLSPFLGQRCRFYPSCSEYAVEAIESCGLIRGGFLAAYRLLRCNPLSSGGYDPVIKG